MAEGNLNTFYNITTLWCRPWQLADISFWPGLSSVSFKEPTVVDLIIFMFSSLKIFFLISDKIF